MNFKNAFLFLAELQENNSKAWFDANRDRYDLIKKEWEAIVQQLIVAIGKFDQAIGELEAKHCIFRINRDVRFSKDKSPYKTTLSAIFAKGGKKSPYAGYYVQMSLGEFFMAGGMWMPDSVHLQSVRQEIDYHPDSFISVVENPVFKKQFGDLENEKLSSVPKGFDKNSEVVEYLKYKSFVATYKTTDIDIFANEFVKNVCSLFEKVKPLNDFLNRAIDHA